MDSKKSWWIITMLLKRENGVFVDTISLECDGSFFSMKIIDEIYKDFAQWSIIFCVRLTERQFKIYNNRNV